MKIILKFNVFRLLLFLSSISLHAQSPYVLVLGIAQDGGYPQAGCNKLCCKPAWNDIAKRKKVSCIAVIDPASKQSWLIDATPDFSEQLYLLRKHMKDSSHMPSGIFITHAHIGHYTGLMDLGKEVMGARDVPVYAMQRMSLFLKNNGPWNQLVKTGNIRLEPGQDIKVTRNLRITPVLVPHRDEYSETVGFQISGDKLNLLYIPDIDKWDKFTEIYMPYTVVTDTSTAQKIAHYFQRFNTVLIDGTFYKDGELGERNMKDVPHPFIHETMNMLEPQLSMENRKKIHFIHLNHTNPLLWNTVEQKKFKTRGFSLAEEGMKLY